MFLACVLQQEQKECETLQLALAAARQDYAELEKMQQARDSVSSSPFM
jgi:hypothetical protein